MDHPDGEDLMQHYVVSCQTKAGKLWLSEPRRSGCADRFSESRWTSIEDDAFMWADRQSASKFVGTCRFPHQPLCVIEPGDGVSDQDQFAISDDVNAPGPVKEASRGESAKGRTRITYRGV